MGLHDSPTGVSRIPTPGRKGPGTPGDAGTPVKLSNPDSRVHVYCRVKPLDYPESSGPAPCVREVTGLNQIVHNGVVAGERTYTYDGVFDRMADQLEVYTKVGRPVLREVMTGVHGCILAYGQTGSGKTHSLLNVSEGQDSTYAGLVPRLFSELFVNIASDFQHIYLVSVAMFQ
ncbi:hypothetical protein CYMTET_35257, partial [Cymbomonas tetramitiformis]